MNAHPKGDTNNQPARMTRTLDTQPGRHHIHPPLNNHPQKTPNHKTNTLYTHPTHTRSQKTQPTPPHTTLHNKRRTTKNHKTAPFQRKVPITREEGVSYTGTNPQNFRQAKPTHLVSRAAVAVVVLVSVVFVGGFVLACTGVRWGSLCRVGVGLGVGCGGVRLLFGCVVDGCAHIVAGRLLRNRGPNSHRG